MDNTILRETAQSPIRLYTDSDLHLSMDSGDAMNDSLSDPIQSEMRRMLREHESIYQKLFSEWMVIGNWLVEIDREKLTKIAEFKNRLDPVETKKIPFIRREDHSFDLVTIRSLFERLDVNDQLEIATGDWKQIDLIRRPIDYVIVLKLLFDITLDKETSERHPYLIARRGDLSMIVSSIVKFSMGSEETMRDIVHNYSPITGISVPTLISKCIAFMNSSSSGMMRFGF